MKDVFISYKAEEFDEANWVRTTLETNGISCWMAPMCIPGGSSYATEIPQAIRECKVFVLMLSKKSQISKWVPRELDQAINEGKTVLPFMLDNCSLKDDFNFYLTNVQRYAAYENKTKAIEKMMREIKAILGIKDEVPEEPEEVIGSEPETTDVTARKPKKKAPAKKEKAKKKKPLDNKKKIKLLCIVGGILAAVIIIVAGILILGGSDTVMIAGEEYDKNEFSIHLSDKSLSKRDVKNLRKLNDLYSLHLTNCTLPNTDIGAICSAAEGAVELNNCGLTNEHLNSVDFEALSLRALQLDNNPELTDLKAIVALSDTLTELSFNNCKVSDISFLEGFTALETLNADNNGIADISVLSNCSELRVLSLSGNEISSLNDLAGFEKLERVSVSNNKLSSLTGLEYAIVLKEINACGNEITDLNGLINTTLIEKADLSSNKLTDVSVLSKSSEYLKKINISGNSITDISSISGSRSATEFIADNNELTSLDALSGWVELETLSASNNQINDIKGLKGCNRLKYINLANNQIRSTESILHNVDITYAITLDLSDNEITELVLPSVKYDYLALYGNSIADLSALNKTTGSSLVFEYNPGTDFDSLGDSEYSNYYIFDCPPDKQVSVGDMLGGSNRVSFTSRDEFLASRQ